MKKILALCLLVLIMVPFLVACGPSEGDFIVGFDDSFPPFGYKDGSKYTGFDIELATEVAKRLDMKLKLQPIEWSAKDMELDTGNISCVWNGFTMHVVNDAGVSRDDLYTWTTPYMKNKQIVIVLADSAYNSLADLSGKKIALQKGSSAEAALDDSAAFKASLSEIVTFSENLTALMDLEIGQVDAVLMDEPVARYNIENTKDGSTKYKILEEVLAEEEFGVGFKLGNTELRDKVQKTLEEMAKDGTMAKISEKWFGKDVTIIGK